MVALPYRVEWAFFFLDTSVTPSPEIDSSGEFAEVLRKVEKR